MRPTSSNPVGDGEANSVEQICHQFLHDREQGQAKPIEHLLKQVARPERPRLLRGLLIVELRSRREAGEDPPVAEYVARFPDQESLVRQVFEMVPPAGKKRVKKAGAPPAQTPAVSGPSPQLVDRPEADHRETARKKRSSPAAGEVAAAEAGPPVDEDDPWLATAGTDDEDRPFVRHRRTKKKEPKPPTGTKKSRRPGDTTPPTEFLIPLCLALASFVIQIVVTVLMPLEGLSVGASLGFKFALILVSGVVTTGALFVAAAVLDTSYGFVQTALIKIAAIVLTQAWLSDVLRLIPGRYVGEIIVWLVTFALFLTFFDLDHLEVIRSMIVVRVVHNFAVFLMFAALIASVAARQGEGSEELANVIGGVAGLRDEGAAAATPQEEAAMKKYRAVTQQFGDALLAKDYPAAYKLTSPEYQAATNLEKFTELHHSAVKKYGPPLRSEADVGETELAELKGESYAKYTTAPPDQRRAWTSVQLAVEVEDGEVSRCCDCWMMLVESGSDLRIGAFEYEWCD